MRCKNQVNMNFRSLFRLLSNVDLHLFQKGDSDIHQVNLYPLDNTIDFPNLTMYLAPVVQKLDSAIHRIISIHWIAQLAPLIFTHWVVIYPVDNTIQVLNNGGLLDSGQI